MAFEVVTGRFLAPDGSPLSGSVVFTPAFSSATDGQAVTAPAPVPAQLDDEGRLEVSLLVPGEGTSPSAWTWRACLRLRHAGGVVGLPAFNFELVAGKPVNLAEVAPVPDPMTGDYITRGEPGAPGPPGEPATVQDTGWRDITALVKLPEGVTHRGSLLLRRLGKVVYFQFVDYSWVGGTGTPQIQGFFPPEISAYTHPPQVMLGGRRVPLRGGGAVPAADRNSFPFTYDWLGPSALRVIRQATHGCHGLVSWLTETDFPASPAGVAVQVV